MQLNEIGADNSGIVQGTFLRRHQIPKPGRRGEFYKFEDLNIGEDIEIYSVVYHIVACDEFTRVSFILFYFYSPSSYSSFFFQS